MNIDSYGKNAGQFVEQVARPRNRGDQFERVTMILGRVLIALLFVLAGGAKILGPKSFLDHMVEVGVPTFLLPAVIALELSAGTALLLGWRTRYAAGALAIFCMMTATIFYHEFGISAERTSFFKDLAIAGGLSAIAARSTKRLGYEKSGST